MIADEHDRLVAAIVFEVHLKAGGVDVVGERWFAPDASLDSAQLAAVGLRPDVLPGLAGGPLEVEDIGELGRLLCNRGYSRFKQPRWVIAGPDLPWALGRLAVLTGGARAGRWKPTDPAAARGRAAEPERSSDGFSIWLAGCTGETVSAKGRTYRRRDFYPRLVITSSGAGLAGAFPRWVPPHNPKGHYTGKQQASFVDLLRLGGALAGGDLDDPAHLCGLFDVPWPTDQPDPWLRFRGEARAMAELYGALTWSLADVAPGMHPRDVYSFGSIADHALHRAGIAAPMSKCADLPPRDLAAAGSASHGGLFRADLVGVPCPMALFDINSTYPTMFELLGLGWVYSCRSIRSEDLDPSALLDLLTSLDRLGDPSTWAAWGLTFATVRPRGQVLPAHLSIEGRDGGLRVAPLDVAGGELTFHWPVLAAAALLGADPNDLDIVRVFTLWGEGTQPRLRPIRTPAGNLIDLRTVGLGAALVDERRLAANDPRSWMTPQSKGFGHFTTYGALLRSDPLRLSKPVETTAHGPHGEALSIRTSRPETPGPFQFTPAAAVSASTTLIMTMLGAQVRALGSAVAAMASDSGAIPCASRAFWAPCPGAPGGRIRVLSRRQLDAILEGFEPLGVHFKTVVPHRLHGRPVTGLVVGRNKAIYATTNEDGAVTVVRSTDTGLGGHLADPSNTPGCRQPDGHYTWAAHCEAAIVAAALNQAPTGSVLALGDQPEWVDRPALRRYRATTWAALQQLRAQTGDHSIGPFARYLRADVNGPGRGPAALGPWPDARDWARADWHLDGEPVGLDVPDPTLGTRAYSGHGRPTRVTVRSVHEHLHHWADTTDPSMTSDQPGLRQPRPICSAPDLVDVVGRDSGELMATDADPTTTNPADSRLVYGTLQDPALRGRVRAAGVNTVARAAGINRSTLSAWLAGGRTCRRTLGLITTALEQLDTSAAPPPRCCARQGCPQPARGHGRWCSDRCRVAASRAAATTPRPAEPPTTTTVEENP